MYIPGRLRTGSKPLNTSISLAEYDDVFDPYFSTPHNLSFEKAADLFDISYLNPENKTDFIESYKKAQNSRNHTIIEINTIREKNPEIHKSLQKKIKEIIKNEL